MCISLTQSRSYIYFVPFTLAISNQWFETSEGLTTLQTYWSWRLCCWHFLGRSVNYLEDPWQARCWYNYDIKLAGWVTAQHPGAELSRIFDFLWELDYLCSSLQSRLISEHFRKQINGNHYLWLCFACSASCFWGLDHCLNWQKSLNILLLLGSWMIKDAEKWMLSSWKGKVSNHLLFLFPKQQVGHFVTLIENVFT